VRITHVGGPTALIEIGGLRLLTDPTFDEPGRRYSFGWGSFSRKVAGPAVATDALGPIDAVLLSHDHHADNLDAAGRALLPSAGTVITTAPGARRLGDGAVGLRAWETTRLGDLEIVATPCRHGPRLLKPLFGEVIGFALRREGRTVWISGDTVMYDGVRSVAERLAVDTAIVHLGGVRFPVTGPLRYTLTASEAIELCRLIRPRQVIPIHYEGWAHFREGRSAIERELAAAPDVPVRWLPIGEPVELSTSGGAAGAAADGRSGGSDGGGG
jgi:L-ascorbate metabolism protein UlaG (beta-lactamase superfamily)